MESLLSAAVTVAKKKFGYQRSWRLSKPGLRLYLWKAVLSANGGKAKLNKNTVAQINKCEIDLAKEAKLTKRKVYREVHSTRANL